MPCSSTLSSSYWHCVIHPHSLLCFLIMFILSSVLCFLLPSSFPFPFLEIIYFLSSSLVFSFHSSSLPVFFPPQVNYVQRDDTTGDERDLLSPPPINIPRSPRSPPRPQRPLPSRLNHPSPSAPLPITRCTASRKFKGVRIFLCMAEDNDVVSRRDMKGRV